MMSGEEPGCGRSISHHSLFLVRDLAMDDAVGVTPLGFVGPRVIAMVEGKATILREDSRIVLALTSKSSEYRMHANNDHDSRVR